jgi:hypothetical protein
MGIYRAYLDKKLKWYHWCLLWWVVLIGFVVDVLANITIAVIVFRELPKELLVTTRLTRYINDTNAHIHNKMMALWICDNLLDLFDPTENHC